VEATRRDSARARRRGSRSLARSVRGRQRGGSDDISNRLVAGLGFVRRKSRIPTVDTRSDSEPPPVFFDLDEYIP
jgi:hypothetical protein